MSKKKIFLVGSIIVITILIGLCVGASIFLSNETTRIQKTITTNQKAESKKQKIVQKHWTHNDVQAVSEGFFKAYHTFNNQTEYNLRPNIVAKYAQDGVLKDEKLFTSDTAYGESYIDTAGLRSKTERIIYFPQASNKQKKDGLVSVSVVSRYGSESPGAMLLWYKVTYDRDSNKFSAVTFLGKEDVGIDSNVVRNNQQN